MNLMKILMKEKARNFPCRILVKTGTVYTLTIHCRTSLIQCKEGAIVANLVVPIVKRLITVIFINKII